MRKTLLISLLIVVSLSQISAAAQDSAEILEQAHMAEDAAVSHYTRLSIYITPMATETVSDEVWRDGMGRWRLERSSDTWDDGLLAVNDGRLLMVQVPYLAEVLQVPAQTPLFAGTSRTAVDPDLFDKRTDAETFEVHGDEQILGRPAILLVRKAAGYEIRRWIDARSQLPLREERLDKTKRPVMVVIRQDLMATPPPFYHLNASKVLTTPQEWRNKAILTWLAAKVPYTLPLYANPPTWLHIEWLAVQSTSAGVVVVFLVDTGKELATVWLAPAVGGKPASRPLQAQGRTALMRRIGKVDITVIADTERQALRLFNALITPHLPSPAEADPES